VNQGVDYCLDFKRSSRVMIPTLQMADLAQFAALFQFPKSLSRALVKKTGYVVCQQVSLLCSSSGTEVN